MTDAQTSSNNASEKKEQHTPCPIANKEDKSDPKIDVPTFTRVIIIRRILVNDMIHVTGNNGNNNEYTKGLVTEMKNLDNSIQSSVYNTLHCLMKDNGIKNYFSSWDEQDNNPNIIETIFNKLILTKFINEYQDATTYNSRSNDYKHYYQDKIFNMKDVMCSMFKFLNYNCCFKGDLFNCSLVCSHWLYYVYDTPIFTIPNFNKLIKNTAIYNVKKDNDDNNSGAIRWWQRLSKVNLIDSDYSILAQPNQLLLNKLLILQNVKEFRGRCNLKFCQILQTIISQSKDKIEHFSLRVKLSGTNGLSPLLLPNVKFVTINHLY